MQANKLTFYFMDKDTPCSKVCLTGNQVEVEIYDPNPLRNYVMNMPLDKLHLLERLEMRCFPRNRSNVKEILNHMGLEEYNVLEIVKKTHGVLADDHTWIRFEGEDISFKDVSRRVL